MNQQFEVQAQHLASELTTNPEVAATELRAELYNHQPVREIQALANEANRLAGPSASHLVLRQTYGRLDVQVVPPGGNNLYNNPASSGYVGGPNYYGPTNYPPNYGAPGIGIPGAGVIIENRPAPRSPPPVSARILLAKEDARLLKRRTVYGALFLATQNSSTFN